MPKTVPHHARIASRLAAPGVIGVVRRLQALAVAGWPRPYLATELRIAECHLARLHEGRVSFPALATRVHELYERLSTQEAPYVASGWITRGRAIANGWVGPDAWTPVTIDDPDARPLTNKVRICIEDLQWMIETGERLKGACRRLDVQPPTLFRTLERAHRTDLWQRLAAREAA